MFGQGISPRCLALCRLRRTVDDRQLPWLNKFGLPDIGGFHFCHRWNQMRNGTPFLVCRGFG